MFLYIYIYICIHVYDIWLSPSAPPGMRAVVSLLFASFFGVCVFAVFACFFGLVCCSLFVVVVSL